jgi:hypothetical protein
VEESNELKRRFEGQDSDAYRQAKQVLIERLLREHDPARFDGGNWPWPDR